MTQPTRTFVDDFATEGDPEPLYTFTPASEPLADISDSPSPERSFHLTSYLTGLLTALVLVGGMNLLLRRPEPPAIVLQPPPTLAPTSTPLPTATPAPIVIFVSGAVQAPGMYALVANARVGDALVAAGGLTLQANVPLVNQAELLWDGAQVHVPFVINTADTRAEAAPATDPASQPLTLQEPAVPAAGLSGAATVLTGRGGMPGEGGLININRASPTELETLPGIGASKAAAIVANRPYSTVDDLERVPGIGAKTVEQLRPLVTVE